MTGNLRGAADPRRDVVSRTPGVAFIRVAAILASAIVVVTLLGIAYSLASPAGPLAGTGLRSLRLGLDQEWSLPSVFSSAILVIASAYSFTYGRVVGRRYPALLTNGFGCFLAFMALDELVAIHERIEVLVGVDWQLIYLPIIALGGAIWLAVLRLVWPDRLIRVLLISGATAWLIAQVFEGFQRGRGGVLLHRWTIAPEESLEMTGSALFLLAMLRAVTALRSAQT